MARVTDFYVDAGSYFASLLIVCDANKQPLNLTGYTVKAQIKKHPEALTSYEITTSLFSAAAGQVKLYIDQEVSSALKKGTWFYDVEITHIASGAKKRVSEGLVFVNPQITTN